MSKAPAAPLAGVIDSHCHLQHLAPEERGPAIERARERGVRGFLVPATHLEEADDILALCEAHPDVWCALGVHPHDASRWQPGDDARLAALLAHPKAVAVGECGLDFHYDLSPRDAQDRALREQWAVALDLGLPVVVHNRESDAAMLAVYGEPAHAALQADFHSYSGGMAMAERLLQHPGSWFGVSGMVTFNRAENVREVLPRISPERLLVETDTPFLAPVPYRGKPNEPGYVVEVARRLAVELAWEPERLAAQTTRNFFALFPRAAAATPAQP